MWTEVSQGRYRAQQQKGLHMPLYEYAITLKPTKKEAEDGVEEKLLVFPVCVVADDERSARTRALLDSKERIEGAPVARLEVYVRPF